MPGYADIEQAAQVQHLDIFGGFHPVPGDNAPSGTETLILLGPREPGFWPAVTATPEFQDSAPDPMDRWSQRVIDQLATDLGATPLYPFGGPPFQPFIGWALRSGRAWSSPVTLLVHDRAGLFVSYRGALAFDHRIDLPPPTSTPCDTCAERPCLSACPVGALDSAGYDLNACHGYLNDAAGHGCMSAGCAVRRACPQSQSYGRMAEQSAFHMAAFHR